MEKLKLGIVLVILGYLWSGCGKAVSVPAPCSVQEAQAIAANGNPSTIQAEATDTLYVWDSNGTALTFTVNADGSCAIADPLATPNNLPSGD